MKKIKKQILKAVEYRKQNPSESLTKIAQQFKIDRHTLSDYCNLKINNDNLFESHKKQDENYLYFFSDEELSYIDYYKEHPNINPKELKEKFPKAPEIRALRNWMNILGNTYYNGNNYKYNYDRNKFSVIETEEDAYWLGFITADGCILENRWLQIKLAAKDKGHLVKFGKYMGLSTAEIDEIIKDEVGGAYTHDNPVNTIKICSKNIIENLMDKGISPRKSGKEKPYKCNSIQLDKAYIRGLIDGDGYLGSTAYRVGLVGSLDICNYVYNFINNNIVDISKNHIREHGIIWKLEINSKEKSSKILKYLYNNSSIFLDRKKELFETRYNN